MVVAKVRSSVRPGECSSEHPSRERMRVAPEVVAVNMRVCGDCGELRGRFTDPYDRAERLQACACEGPASQRSPWPRYDLNTVVDVCFCCASALVHSGTLASPLFCDACLQWVEHLNENEGRTVIPEDRQAATDPSQVGLLSLLGKMKAYRRARVQSHLTMWFGEVPREGVSTLDYARRVSPPAFETFRTFVRSVIGV